MNLMKLNCMVGKIFLFAHMVWIYFGFRFKKTFIIIEINEEDKYKTILDLKGIVYEYNAMLIVLRAAQN